MVPKGWRDLISIDGRPVEYSGPIQSAPHASAGPDEISVSWTDGCNSMWGRISIYQDGRAVPIGDEKLGEILGLGAPALIVTSTAMACIKHPVDPNPGLGSALTGVKHWRLDEQGRLILEGRGHTVVFDSR
jgi:heat shock protein HslJ